MANDTTTLLAPPPPGPTAGFRAADVGIPAGLIALAAVPTLAGVVRLSGLATGVVTPENARFAADPIPAIVHIVGATVFCLLGAFQFSPGLRRRRLGWHRAAGRALAPLGLVAALSGVWMTVSYPHVEYDAPVVYAMRVAVGASMAGFILLSLAALGRRDFPAHGAWMTRAYALGIGAGTQALTHLPLFLFEETRNEAGRALAMGAGWAINVAVAEWALGGRCRRQSSQGRVRASSRSR